MKVEFTREALDAATGLPESPHAMSNCDGTVDEGMEADLRAGMRSEHTAWNFWGMVWFDPASGRFFEEVLRYHATQAVYSAASLKELMAEVNDEFGWE